MAGLRLGDGVGDEVMLVAVEAAERVENGVLGGVGVQPARVAACGVVAGAGEAGVVAVDAAAAVRAGADHRLAAGRAAHQPGEQVVGSVRGPLGVVLAAGGQDPLRTGKDGVVDDGRVAAGGGDAAEGQLSQVDAAGQHAQHLVGGPGPAGGGPVTAVVQHAGNSFAAEPVPDVGVEDEPDDGGLVRVGDERAGGGVDLVAERAAAALPFPGGGLALHAGDHPVDDGVAFELGEHAEHLGQHPAHRGGCVERLGRRPERHPGLVEVVEQGDQVAQAAGEPVDPVHQQHVDHPGPRRGERALQAGPVRASTGGVVGEPGGLPPAGLGADVGGEPGVLGLDGVGLVLVVGGPAHVNTDPHVTAAVG
ncbi:MAG: hypothetical protein WBH47_01245 [Streptosporangiaceae bacterium]